MVGNKIEVNGNVIELYTSYEDLPMERFNKFNKFILKDSDIGGDIPSYVQRIQRAIDFLNAGSNEDAVQELNNLSYTVIALFNEYNLSQCAFACMVKKINNKPKDDLTDEGIAATIDELTKLGLTQKTIIETNDSLKKK